MDNETYEALKMIINQRGYHFYNTETGKKAYQKMIDWVDEVAKEYEVSSFEKMVRDAKLGSSQVDIVREYIEKL